MIHLYEVWEGVKHETQKVDCGVKWLGGGEVVSWCLMGTEFQLEKMKKFWRWMVVMVAR